LADLMNALKITRADREKVGRIGGQAYERDQTPKAFGAERSESARQQKLRAFSDHNIPANHFGKRSIIRVEPDDP
jgi:hypothetical protein